MSCLVAIAVVAFILVKESVASILSQSGKVCSQAYQSDVVGTANSSSIVLYCTALYCTVPTHAHLGKGDHVCMLAQNAEKRHTCNTSTADLECKNLPFKAIMALWVQEKRVLETHASAPASCVR